MKSLFFGRILFLSLSWLILTSCGDTWPWGDNYERSFRGVKWGSSPEESKGLKILLEIGGKRLVAVREDEDLRFGEAVIDKVTYIFFNRKFGKVQVDYSGYKRYTAIKAELQKNLDEPRFEPLLERNTWQTGSVVIVLRFYRLTGKGNLVFTDNRVLSEERPGRTS